MSLTTEAVDRLFSRLSAVYGVAWERQMGSAPLSDVKSAWGHELSGFSDKLGMLAWALENLPERCPNAIEFRNLARRAPAPETARLPEPKADAARVAAELANLATAMESTRSVTVVVDHKAWAKRIIARHDSGENLNQTSLKFAMQALGLAA